MHIRKRLISNILKRQDGLALPSVLAMFAIGSLLILPSINFIATNLNMGRMAEEEFKGIISADAGVEDALWKIKNEMPSPLPHSYQLTDINGHTVDITIDDVDTLVTETIGQTGGHADWLSVNATTTYDYVSGNYSYSMSLTNNHTETMKIENIMIDFPPDVDYVTGSMSSNVTQPLDKEPAVIGSSLTGITLVWNNGTPRPSISGGGTEWHCFKLSGPPDLEGIEGHGFVEAKSEDIGTVWIMEMAPYSIEAIAKDDSGAVVATIIAGVWGSSSKLEISCWRVIP